MLEVLRALFGSARTQSSLVVQATGQFLEMLDNGRSLLEKAQPHLLVKDAGNNLLNEARDIDKSTNRLVRAVRKILIAHLAFNKQDASTCLILMSVVKDAERLVDECRSLLNLASLVVDPVPEEYRKALSENCTAVIEVLKSTRTAYADNDEAKALGLVETEKPFIESMKPVRDKILDDTDLNPRQAVVTASAFHTIQRIRAHLGNIASTVVFPVHQIDFTKQKFVNAAKQRLNK
ncbi:MAG: hypothetical protein O7E57_13220 [Gammaproteobacteria bacterium]|nr:hypothetical protein [Gammaproteobacteria bacterium]